MVSYLDIGAALGLVLFGGLMSGLTLGLLSLSTLDLQLTSRSSDDGRRRVERLMPLLKSHHRLLVTLLLWNSLANEALPIFFGRLMGEYTSILVSVTAVLLFGEILPQAICSRYGLAIGSALVPVVRTLSMISCPVTWPLAKLLDLLLGGANSELFNRRRLQALMELGEENNADEIGVQLSRNEIGLIQSVLQLSNGTAADLCVPLSDVEDEQQQGVVNGVLVICERNRWGERLKALIAQSKCNGHVFVHREGHRYAILGSVAVSDLLGLREGMPVCEAPVRALERVKSTASLDVVLEKLCRSRQAAAVLVEWDMKDVWRPVHKDESPSSSLFAHSPRVDQFGLQPVAGVLTLGQITEVLLSSMKR